MNKLKTYLSLIFELITKNDGQSFFFLSDEQTRLLDIVKYRFQNEDPRPLFCPTLATFYLPSKEDQETFISRVRLAEDLWNENPYKLKELERDQLIISIIEKSFDEFYTMFYNATFDSPEESKNLTLRQIALLNLYRGIRITGRNADEILKDYRQNSGQKLVEKFESISQSRTNFSTVRSSQSLHTDIKKIIPLLTDKSKAEDELRLLKAQIEKHRS